MLPLGIAGINLAGLGPVSHRLSSDDLRRREHRGDLGRSCGCSASTPTTSSSGTRTAPGPLDWMDPAEWRVDGTRTQLVNTGCWTEEPRINAQRAAQPVPARARHPRRGRPGPPRLVHDRRRPRPPCPTTRTDATAERGPAGTRSCSTLVPGPGDVARSPAVWRSWRMTRWAPDAVQRVRSSPLTGHRSRAGRRRPTPRRRRTARRRRPRRRPSGRRSARRRRPRDRRAASAARRSRAAPGSPARCRGSRPRRGAISNSLSRGANR